MAAMDDMPDRSVARGLLMIGTAVVVINGVFLFQLYGPGAHQQGPMFVDPPPYPIILVMILAFAASLFGLWRMWRVWRGSH